MKRPRSKPVDVGAKNANGLCELGLKLFPSPDKSANERL